LKWCACLGEEERDRHGFNISGRRDAKCLIGALWEDSAAALIRRLQWEERSSLIFVFSRAGRCGRTTPPLRSDAPMGGEEQSEI
jgi:hypothetical protein